MSTDHNATERGNAMETTTNIKGLPEGKYFTESGWSDSYPWIEVGRTPKTVKLARVRVKDDPVWKAKMDFRPGGFVGTVVNQGEQTWLYDRIDREDTVSIRRRKKDGKWAYNGVVFTEDRAIEFYDYNF